MQIDGSMLNNDFIYFIYRISLWGYFLLSEKVSIIDIN